MLSVIACSCSSTDSLIRNFLKRAGYPDWLSIKIYKGKEASKRLIHTLPHYPELEMLENFIENASKWAVIIGYDEQSCRWSDISHGRSKSGVEASLLVEHFA